MGFKSLLILILTTPDRETDEMKKNRLYSDRWIHKVALINIFMSNKQTHVVLGPL